MLFSRITFAVNNRKQKDKIKMTDKILKKSRVYRIKKVKRSRQKGREIELKEAELASAKTKIGCKKEITVSKEP